MTNFNEIFFSATPGKLLKEQCQKGNYGLPFLNYASELTAGPANFHSGSILDHMCRCMDECAADPLAVWLAFTHDCGKLISPVAMLPHHYGHEYRGEKLASIWGEYLNLPLEWQEAGEFCAKNHMRAAKYSIVRPGKRLDILLETMTQSYTDSFWRVVDADSKSSISKIVKSHWQKFIAQNGANLDRDSQIRLLLSITT